MSKPKILDIGFKVFEPLLWKIKIPTEDIPLSILDDNLDIPYREQEGTDDRNLSPRLFLQNPAQEPTHLNLVEQADLAYPICLYRYQEQRIILDGVHRFVKAHLMKQKNITVKFLTKEDIFSVGAEQEEPLFLLASSPFLYSQKELESNLSCDFLDELKKKNHYLSRLYCAFLVKHKFRLQEKQLIQANLNHQRGNHFFSASYS